VFIAWKVRLYACRAAAGILLGFSVNLWLNLQATGRLFGIYKDKLTGDVGFRINPLENLETLAALFISPSRGLFVFSPWCIIMIAGLAAVLLSCKWRRPWWVLNSLFLLGNIAMLAVFTAWWGGWSNGPRLQSDFLLSATIVTGPALAWILRRTWSSILLILLFVPALFIQTRSAQMVRHSWESIWANDQVILAQVWSWPKGAWLYNATLGRTERVMRGEERPPLAQGPVFNPATPDVMRYFESGIAVNEQKNAFAMTSRQANLLFQYAEKVPTPSKLILQFRDTISWGQIRELRILLNNQQLGLITYMSGSGQTRVQLNVPAELLKNPGEINRLTLSELHPPHNEYGDAYLIFDSILLLSSSDPAPSSPPEKQTGILSVK